MATIEPLQLIIQAILNTDGGSRGNPGASGIGFTLRIDNGKSLETASAGGAYIGLATNNQAEYQALIWGLKNAAAFGICHLDIQADSELMIKQLSGEYKVKNEGIKPLHAEALGLLSGFAAYTLTHIVREANTAADALVNEAIDKRGSVGAPRLAYTSGKPFEQEQSAKKTAASKTSRSRERTQSGEPLLIFPDLRLDRINKMNLSGENSDSNSGENSGEEPRENPDEKNASDVPLSASDALLSASAAPFKKGEPMYTLTVKDHFDAAHALFGYPGECKNLHGHTWDIEASVRGAQLNDIGILYDFKLLKADLRAVLDAFDHKYLNETAPFDVINATAENLARVIYEQLEASLPEYVELEQVAVWESPVAKLTYTRK